MLLPFLYHSCSYILFFTSYACRHTKTGLWTACPKNLLEHLGITVRCLDEQLGLMFRIYPLFQHFNTFGPLEENTLDAVFTLPNEIFYPGASASACCMVFKIGIKHTDISNPDTFFGYCKDDGFKKKKNLGRVEQVDSTTGKSRWVEIEKEWIELYRNRRSVDGLSATHKVSGDDEWLCEAYMKTDYTKLSERDFQQTINDYLAYLVKEGHIYES